jgi:hypothetical protein
MTAQVQIGLATPSEAGQTDLSPAPHSGRPKDLWSVAAPELRELP